ncbi:unnamed protein product [Penicillium salamii]|uniref:Ankyrin n=1 Tax=Penicillium salamii TaxID=1612424 RepID=A0A9W4JB31_9EURO|nr:unnamed protein product [Penicillium salamii]CAG8124491.1 unnamed protein product [Penicillium salamii]CAG8225394.1 unnamed protein product [Penicillium salamii]CAG8306514.1 unnamed protein product [Penicillium salamii]CAG8328411.1 unnamed protein product [Penicillium salamii]
MRLPIELLQLILQEAVDILPYGDILHSRLVNNLFNKTLWPTSARIDHPEAIFTVWRKFPYKRKYLWHLIENHQERPCFFSELCHDILQMPHIATTSENEKHILMDKMINVILRSTESPRMLFSPLCYRACIANVTDASGGRIEPLELTLASGLAASAILRGDHVELQSLLDEGVWLMRWSETLGQVPVDLAYKEGTPEIINIVAPRYSFFYQSRSRWTIDHSCGLAVAARRGDAERVELLIKANLDKGWDISLELSKAVEGVLRIGKVEMVEVLEKYMTRPRESMQWLWFYCYNEAVKNGMLHVVRWLFNREGPLMRQTSPWHKTPLFIALHDCPSNARLEMVRLLLENGADPNGNGGLEVSQTPLQRAIQNGDLEAAMLLVEFGADPNRAARRTVPLHMAVQQGHPALVRCMLEHGAKPRYQSKGKRYTVRRSENFTTLLEDLGFDQVTEQEYVIMYRPDTGSRVCEVISYPNALAAL